MSVEFILDGYNILHQMDIDPALSIDVQRMRLVEQIESRRPQGSWNNDLTIIFDGRPGPTWHNPVTSFKIVFSMDISADDNIRCRLETGQNNKLVTVITDDRELQGSVRARGAKVMAVHDFLARMAKPTLNMRKSSSAGVNSGKYLSKTTEYKINKEFEDIWLGKNTTKVKANDKGRH